MTDRDTASNLPLRVSDEQAVRTAEITRWGLLAMHHEAQAHFCERMARLAAAAPRVAATLTQLEFGRPDAFTEELIGEIGEFRETPFGIVGGEGQNDTITRAARRKELEIENQRLTEEQSYRQMLETKSILGTDAEKTEAFAELAELDERDDEGSNNPDIEA